ncbi:ArsR/SmtB family transcription factor [Paractinoplanes deccanensis]|uniref:ArsR/SmtB family transcription factor n=1 Tax=Paractinoplanes deccanensis TaxID=113561 RepID=UPI0019411421|nr:helix-turn-helix domain-containing protein [Actinoplanes deccanensis]
MDRKVVRFRLGTADLSQITFAVSPGHVTWAGDEVHVRVLHYGAVIDCEGSGLTLVPSVMSTPRCAVITERGAQPTLFYPAHGVTETWTGDGTTAAAALTALLGEGRARVLLCLDGPRSTSETAALCGLAVSTASHHLAVLRGAGLVDSTRAGAAVRHSRSVLGEALTSRQ